MNLSVLFGKVPPQKSLEETRVISIKGTSLNFVFLGGGVSK